MYLILLGVFSSRPLYLKCLLSGGILGALQVSRPFTPSSRSHVGLKADVGSKALSVEGKTEEGF